MSDQELQERIQKFIKETTTSNTIDSTIKWMTQCFFEAKNTSKDRLGNTKHWYFFHYTLHGVNDHDFFDYIVLMLFDVKIERKKANEWWFKHNDLQFVIELGYPPVFDRRLVSKEGDMCWVMSAQPFEQSPEKKITNFISEKTRIPSSDSRILRMLNILKLAKNKSTEKDPGRQNWFFFNFPLHGISLDKFFQEIVMTYFGVSADQKGPCEWWFEYNNLQCVIKLVEYPYGDYLERQIASTIHDKCWKFSVMPLGWTELHSEFKKTLYSLHNRLCALEGLNKNIH